MKLSNRAVSREKSGNPVISGFMKFQSSIFGRVVFIVAISSVFLFVSFWILFRSANEGYMKSIIHQNGSNIAALVESALYKSMLENDRTTLQSTLDAINSMSGIDDVNMYDSDNNLAYSSISVDTANHSDPDCKSCHRDIATMFPVKDKSVRIIDINSECRMSHNLNDSRHLLIRSPILNSESCYTSACHAHNRNEEVLGALLIKFPLKDLDESISKSRRNYMLLATLITALMVILFILLTMQQIKKPLTALIAASEAVASGDKSKRLEIKPIHLSDMRMVSTAFNDMLDNLQKANIELENWSKQLEYKVQKKSEELGQAQHEMINIERIASLGRLSLSVAHEINNPLSGILVYAKLLHKQLNNPMIDPEKKETMLKHLGFIISESMRCGDIVRGLLDFSRKDQNDFEPRHLHEILNDTYELMSHSMKVANVNFLSDFSARSDLIFCSPNQIKQVMVAVLMNAMEAISENGEVLIRTLTPNDRQIRIEISDNGTGISEEDLPHIFEPFFSTKEKAKGIGLGLSIVHGIIQNHKGKIDVTSERGKGTTIAISLSLLKN